MKLNSKYLSAVILTFSASLCFAGGTVGSAGEKVMRIVVNGERAQDLMNALSAGGAKISPSGQITTGPVTCHADDNSNFAEATDTDAGLSKSPVCFKSQYLDEGGTFSESYWITQSLKQVGVPAIDGMHGQTDVSVQSIHCQSDLNAPLFLEDANTETVNPARFKCVVVTRE